MSKLKSPGGGHSSHHKSVSVSKHNHQSNLSSMDKVKIKRVKRNKKEVTNKEKILAGLGVGGSLLGGIAGVAPKANQTNIVSTTGNEQQRGASKVKSVLNKIFGPFGVGVAKADDNSLNVVSGTAFADINNSYSGTASLSGDVTLSDGTVVPAGNLTVSAMQDGRIFANINGQAVDVTNDLTGAGIDVSGLYGSLQSAATPAPADNADSSTNSSSSNNPAPVSAPSDSPAAESELSSGSDGGVPGTGGLYRARTTTGDLTPPGGTVLAGRPDTTAPAPVAAPSVVSGTAFADQANSYSGQVAVSSDAVVAGVQLYQHQPLTISVMPDGRVFANLNGQAVQLNNGDLSALGITTDTSSQNPDGLYSQLENSVPSSNPSGGAKSLKNNVENPEGSAVGAVTYTVTGGTANGTGSYIGTLTASGGGTYTLSGGVQLLDGTFTVTVNVDGSSSIRVNGVNVPLTSQDLANMGLPTAAQLYSQLSGVVGSVSTPAVSTVSGGYADGSFYSGVVNVSGTVILSGGQQVTSGSYPISVIPGGSAYIRVNGQVLLLTSGPSGDLTALGLPDAGTIYSQLVSSANSSETALTISTTTLPSATSGSAYNASLSAVGGTGPYTWSASGLFSGLAINPLTGAITGTPSAVPSATTIYVTVTATDSAGNKVASQPLSLTINPASALPTQTQISQMITDASSGMLSGDEVGLFSSYFGNGQNQSQIPHGFTANSEFAYAMNMPGSPSNGSSAKGTNGITYYFSNGSWSDNAPAGILTISTTTLPSATSGSAYNASLSAVGGTGPYTWSASGLFSGLAINPLTGAITGTPSAVPSATTIYVTVTATDSAGNKVASQPLSLTINPASALPTQTQISQMITDASSGMLSGDEVGLFSSYFGNGQNQSQIPHGFTANSEFAYAMNMPGSPSNGSSAKGTNGITYYFSNGSWSDNAPAGILTISTTTLPSATSGSAYNASLSAVGGTGPYTWSASGLPSGLSLNAGTISGTPSVAGTYQISVTVTDSTGAAFKQQLGLTVSTANPSSSLSITTSGLGNATAGLAGYSQTLSAIGGYGGYKWSASGLPSGLFMDASGNITGAGPSTPGSYTVTIAVTDSGGLTASKQFNLKVVSASQMATISSIDTTAGAAGQNYTVTVTGTNLNNTGVSSPSPYLTFGSPTVSSDGTTMTFTVSVAQNAAPGQAALIFSGARNVGFTISNSNYVPPSAAPVSTAGSVAKATATLTNSKPAAGSNIGAGDTEIITVVNGPANTPVYAVGGMVGGTQGNIYLGTTDATGLLQYTTAVTAGSVGNWKVTIKFGSAANDPNVMAGTVPGTIVNNVYSLTPVGGSSPLSFTVSATPALGAATPVSKAGSAATAAATLTNGNGVSGLNIGAGDTEIITVVNGPANTPVYAVGGMVGGTQGNIYLGTTDATGLLQYTTAVTAGSVGTWKINIAFGSAPTVGIVPGTIVNNVSSLTPAGGNLPTTFKISATPALGATPPVSKAGSAGTASVALANANPMSGSNIGVGDTEVITVLNGPANTPVYAVGGMVGGTQGNTYLGTTDANGLLQYTAIVGAGQAGNWNVRIGFGSAVNDPNVKAGIVPGTLVTNITSLTGAGNNLTPFTIAQTPQQPTGLSGGNYYLDHASLNVTGPTGNITYLNPDYYASAATASNLATLLGGKAVNVPIAISPGDPYTYSTAAQNQWFIQLPDGAMLNAGAVATMYTHGYPASMVVQMISNEASLDTAGYNTTATAPNGSPIASWSYLSGLGYIATDSSGAHWLSGLGSSGLSAYTGPLGAPVVQFNGGVYGIYIPASA